MILKNNKKALVVVAHPDDETIWMGGAILKYSKVEWTIFSLCRAGDKDRAPKFKKVCDYYGAKSIIADLDDENEISIERLVEKIKKIINNKVQFSEYSYIFTHGNNGEYGHSRHIAVYESIKQLLKDKKNKPEAAFYFNYKKINKKEFSPLTEKKNSDWLLKLSNIEYVRKKSIMSNIYGFNPDGIDANYCTNPEAFEIHCYKKFNK